MNDWKEIIGDEFHKEYFMKLSEYLKEEYKNFDVFPPCDSIFHAFEATPYHKVRALIIGQDPYHNEHQAHGMCFSIYPDQKKIPPSLVNIYKELRDDLEYDIPKHGNLGKWAEQGVLLLNTVLTVRAHKANSHQGKGWEQFTDRVIQEVNKINKPIVIILWGKPAQKKKKMLDNPLHLILEAPHPSPLSSFRGFFGSKPFSKTNAYLESFGLDGIDWEIK